MYVLMYVWCKCEVIRRDLHGLELIYSGSGEAGDTALLQYQLSAVFELYNVDLSTCLLGSGARERKRERGREGEREMK